MKSVPKIKVPLTTEEPVRRPWLRHELEDINKVSDTEEEYLEPDNLTSENDVTTGESSSSDDESFNAQNKIKYIIQTPEDTATESEHQKVEFPMDENVSSKKAGHHLQQRPTTQSNQKEPGDIMSYLAQEMEEYQEKQDDETERYERQVANANTEEDLLGVVDPELLRRTESNRHIPYEEKKAPPTKRPPTVHDESDVVHKNLLVFSENPSIIEQSNKLVVVQYYGAGRSGVMPFAYRQTRKTKSYLVACDFSKESTYAIEWTMGTMMRDGDELHIAAVINREDNPDVVKSTGLDQASELRAASDALNLEAKKLLGQMMLFNITLVTYAMAGRIKDCLKSLTAEKDFTMVICGSRGRSSVRKLLMGSVSTYLVHKSPVPVAVIRRQKKKKRVKSENIEVHSLSEGIRTGQLHVDELG